MDYRPLGRTDLRVSSICLGSMTWGNQNTEAEGHEQMDYALDQGVNFIDTAEMYAVPATEVTYGATETIIGTWLAARKNRDKVILATKVAGPAERLYYVRGGKNRLDKKNIEAAIDTSLKRLQTDHVDLYQLHWPNRSTNFFSSLGYEHKEDPDYIDPAETLDALEGIVKAGKVRQIGVSNETAWGVMRYLHEAEANGKPRMVSIQNPYSLLNRSFEVGLAECAIRDQCGLLAYAPIAAGFLSGKYLGGARPPGSRMAVFKQPSRYDVPNGEKAIERYVGIAKKHGLDPSQMSIAFVTSRPFTTSAIIGATTMDQLTNAIGAADLTLSQEVLDELEEVHNDISNPCP
ncbi:MAG: NADP(H)-dependent aldo-keto reductase [Pseudomonadota bacterium]